jgi:hypothetical protein
MGVTNQELIRLRNAGRITFDKQVSEIVTELLDYRSACLYEDDDDGRYETGCGKVFHLHENLELYDFCPFCGHRVQVLTLSAKEQK